jgi:hypothetical protein
MSVIACSRQLDTRSVIMRSSQPRTLKVIEVRTFLRCVVIFGALFTIIGISTLHGKDAESAFVLQITPWQNAVQPGTASWKKAEPVFFILTMKNNSGHTLHFALTNPALDYRATVLDSQGKPVPETEVFRKMREGRKNRIESGRNILVVLKSGETQQDTIELSSVYELANSGKYTVQIERDMPPELGSGVVESNLVKITVVE